MDSLTRALLIGAPCLVIILVALFPAFGLVILLGAVILAGILFKLGLRTTPEPLRPLIYRWGRLHRLGASGTIFVLPGIDEVATHTIDMRPFSLTFDVYQLAASDGESVYMNLELTWQMHPDITRIDAPLRSTFAKSHEQRERMVEHTVSAVARMVLLNYATPLLKRSDVRETIIDILRGATNDLLAPHGLMVETIFWRGSQPSSDYMKAKLAMKIAHEQIEMYVQDVQTVAARLPGVDPDAFILHQAWLELARRGIAPPIGAFTASPTGLPYMPPPPPRRAGEEASHG